MISHGNDIKEWLRNPNNVYGLLPDNVVLDSLLASGGQGVVYKGSVFGAESAIKIYFPGQLHKRIKREITALEKLDSPNIVRLLWSGTISVNAFDLPVVATALVPGTPLNELLPKRRLNYDQLGTLGYDVACAISSMWERRIIHRDLKPSNIVFLPNGRACVIDLGLARHVELSTLTAMGASWGTYGYLSPEQTRAVKQLTCKSDLFSLGIILVECSMGRHPTNKDQLRLESMRLDLNLPNEISNWEHSQLVKDLLHPRPTKRPRPSTVIATLSKYQPTV